MVEGEGRVHPEPAERYARPATGALPTMSSALSNLCIHRVDWRRHVALCDALRQGGAALAEALRALELRPTDDDLQAAWMLEPGAVPPLLERPLLAVGLRLDPARFVPRTVELHTEDRVGGVDPLAGSVARAVRSLAFAPDSPSTGDLWLIEPVLSLACFSHPFHTLCWGDAPVPDDLGLLARAMGVTVPPTEPVRLEDFMAPVVWSPDRVVVLAAGLEALAPTPVADLAPVRAEFAFHHERGLGPSEPSTEEPLVAWARGELQCLSDLYRTAAAAGEGLDLRWQANP